MVQNTDQATTQQRAWRAVERFNKQRNNLEGLVQALAGRRIPVVAGIGQQSSSSTDGQKIYITPPMELGDDIQHQKHLCNKRSRLDNRLLCTACRSHEEIIVMIFRELGHNIFDTFGTLGEFKYKYAHLYNQFTQLELGKKLAEYLDSTWVAQSQTTFELMKMFSPEFGTFMLNVLEDVRIDTRMFKERPGYAEMMHNQTVGIFKRGNVRHDGTFDKWSDKPANAQAMIGVLLLGHHEEALFDYLHPAVKIILNDHPMNALMTEVRRSDSVYQNLILCVKVIQRLRELGFLEGHQKNPEPQQPPQEEKENQDEQSGPGQAVQFDQAGSDSDSEESDSDESGERDSGSSESGSMGESNDGSGESFAPGKRPDDGGRASGTESGLGGSDGSDQPDAGSDAGSDTGSDTDSGAESRDEQDESSSPDGGDESGRDLEQQGQDDLDQERDDSGSDAGGNPDPECEPGAQDAEQSAQADSGPGTGSGQRDDSSDSEGEPAEDVESSDGTDGSADDVACSPESDQLTEPEAGSVGDPTERAPSEATGTPAPPSQPEPTPQPGDLDGGVEDDLIEALKTFLGHATGKDHPCSEEKPEANPYMSDEDAKDLGFGSIDELRAIVDATEQVGHFESPSQNIGTLAEIEANSSGSFYTGLVNARFVSPRRANDNISIQNLSVGEGILGRALLDLRIAFEENARSHYTEHQKSGKVNTRVLGKRAPMKDSRLFKKRVTPDKRDYAVCISLDCSGSIARGNLFLEEKRAVTAQAELLKRLGVKFAIFGHTGQHREHSKPGSYSNSDLSAVIYKIKDYNEPWTDKQKTRLAKLSPGGGNIDGHSLEYLRKSVMAQKATKRVIMYYSDGEMPAANFMEELDILKREIEFCKKHDVALFGVGIQTDSPSSHGLPTVRVDSDSDLIKVVEHTRKALAQ